MIEWEISLNGFKRGSERFKVIWHKDSQHQAIVEIFMSRAPIYHKGSTHIPTKVWVRKAGEPKTTKVFNAYVVWSITEATPQTKKEEVNYDTMGS